MKKIDTEITLANLAEKLDMLSTTVGNLTIGVKDGFEQQDKKIEGLSDRIDSLAVSMEKRFEQQENKIEEKFLNFAIILNKSFEAQGQEIQKVLNELREFKDEANNRFVTHREFEGFIS